MRNLFLAMAAATLLIGAAPAFAGHSDDIHDNADVRCHYVKTSQDAGRPRGVSHG
jgi:hypothetical protein